jgi:hypothetical protein
MQSWSVHKIYCPPGRALCFWDPWVVLRYRTVLNEELNNHKVFTKHADLQTVSSQGQQTPEHTAQYQILDHTITKAMLCTVKKAGTVFSGKFAWSPMLKAAVSAYQFWRLCLRIHQGSNIPLHTLRTYQEEGDVPPEALGT